MKKNLILSIVRNLEIEELSPFLDSLEKAGYRGEICFFAADISDRTRAALRERGVDLPGFEEARIKFPFRKKKINTYRILFPVIDFYLKAVDAFPRIFGSNDPKQIRLRFARRYFQIFAKRHILYRDYLIAHKGEYENVMLTDIRDVFIQHDPFDFNIDGRLCCFLEDKNYTLATEHFNSIWIRDIYGRDMLGQIGNNPISCAGVTIGSYDSVLHYLDTMVDYLVTNARHRGVDQGMHNYLIWKGLLKNFRLYENNKGPVLTMGLMQESEIRFNEEGRIVNEDGSVVNVLHQFDRLPGIQDRLFKKLL